MWPPMARGLCAWEMILGCLGELMALRGPYSRDPVLAGTSYQQRQEGGCSNCAAGLRGRGHGPRNVVASSHWGGTQLADNKDMGTRVPPLQGTLCAGKGRSQHLGL